MMLLPEKIEVLHSQQKVLVLNGLHKYKLTGDEFLIFKEFVVKKTKT